MLKFENLMSQSDKVFAENRLLKLGFGVLLVATLINSVSISRIDQKRQTHIVPLGHGYSYEFQGKDVSPLYLEHMARSIINLRGNLTASGAKENFQLLLSLYTEDTHSAAREKYSAIADELKKYSSVSYQAIPDAGKPIKNVDNKFLYVEAVKRRIVGNTVTDRKPMIYKIHYEMRDGRFYLREIKELKP